MSPETKSIPTGPAAAAIIASGIGALTLGILTTGAEFSAGLKTALNIYNPAGPLSGKTTFSVAAWLLSWLVLNAMWKNKPYDLGKAFTVTLVLIGLGLALTFPPIFVLFAK
jgi:hypothetical protein